MYSCLTWFYVLGVAVSKKHPTTPSTVHAPIIASDISKLYIVCTFIESHCCLKQGLGSHRKGSDVLKPVYNFASLSVCGCSTRHTDNNGRERENKRKGALMLLPLKKMRTGSRPTGNEKKRNDNSLPSNFSWRDFLQDFLALLLSLLLCSSLFPDKLKRNFVRSRSLSSSCAGARKNFVPFPPFLSFPLLLTAY